MKPYALLSDIHFHNWSAFSATTAEGINSRLAIQCAEMIRAAEELREAGGDTMILAGDTFHVRGSIAPSVLNPVRDTIHAIRAMGIEIGAIPGNHDLEGKESDIIGNAIGALRDAGVYVCDHAELYRGILMVPWHSTCESLLDTLRACRDKISGVKLTDVVIHAPVDGVIPGLPTHGLTAEVLGELGFGRVFAGHYHDHKDLGHGVYSVGATTHQNWGDVGTRAGFLLVGDEVRFRASHAPAFVDVTPEVAPEEIPLIVDGNYVRLKLEDVTEAEIKIAREELLGMGARGVVVHATRKAEVSRTGATAKSGVTLEASVAAYVAAKGFDRATDLAARCNNILTEARASE